MSGYATSGPVDLGVDIEMLSRAVAGQPVDWGQLADQLGDACRASRRRELAQLDGDTGADGSR